jgi:acetyltransferase-like isoleucine patch superfamily enzyme
VEKLRGYWWNARSEAYDLALGIICNVPFALGRWLRSVLLPHFFKSCGIKTVIHSGLMISNPEEVSVGSHCTFARGLFITGGGGVTIGDWVGIGPDSKIWSVNHRFDDPDRPWLLQGWEKKAVVIEDDVWLGANVFIMPGTVIGKGAIISAGTVVNKSIPAYAIVVGNPGRVVGWRKQPVTGSVSTVEAQAGTL